MNFQPASKHWKWKRFFIWFPLREHDVVYSLSKTLPQATIDIPVGDEDKKVYYTKPTFSLFHLYLFSLIELLVVVSIISILMTLLLPSLRQTKEKAKEISCAGNLKQFSSANMMYIDDCSGWLPFSNVDFKLWDYLLMPYIDYTQDIAIANERNEYSIFHCPSGRWYSVWNFSNYRKRGYAYNSQLCFYPNVIRKYNRISRLIKTVLMTDMAQPGDAYNQSERHTFGKHPHGELINSGGGCNMISYRHNNLTNVLFADGHVKSRKKGLYNVSEGGWVPQDTEW